MGSRGVAFVKNRDRRGWLLCCCRGLPTWWRRLALGATLLGFVEAGAAAWASWATWEALGLGTATSCRPVRGDGEQARLGCLGTENRK
jgi:hypothetical protein